LAFTAYVPLRSLKIREAFSFSLFCACSPFLRYTAEMGLDVGDYTDRPDWPKLGPSLLIATALIVAIRAAKWPAIADASTSGSDLDKEIDLAAHVAGRNGRSPSYSAINIDLAFSHPTLARSCRFALLKATHYRDSLACFRISVSTSRKGVPSY
jgi:hypothetical protein